ncbi:MAG: NAD(P)/FAD-dependent oxidoreductase [Steroidobacteraceae bacterium]|jgi:glycine/D-amino acid oxidase-like deaminating enzyme
MNSRRRFIKNSAWAGGAAVLGAAGLNGVSPWIWRAPLPIEPNLGYWARSQPPLNPKLAEDLKVDVAVVGGGLTGLSSAYFLRSISPEKSVVVLEAMGCGNGASGRNGAMVLTMTADRFMNLSADPAMDLKIYDLTAQNIRFLSRLSAATGIDCELQIQGALQVLESDADLRAAQAYVRKARGLGIPVEFWDSPRVAGAVGTSVYRGGFFDPNCGHVHPMKLVHVFKAAAQGAGAKIFENTLVAHIEEGSRGHLLRTADGRTVTARSLVLAANAFTPQLGFLQNSILPIHEYVAVTQPFSEQELEEIGWRLPVPFNDNRTEVFYLGLTQDRRIHIGGGTPCYAFNNGAAACTEHPHVEQLRRELARIYPRLSGIEFAQSWGGVIDWSLDASPSVGRTGRYGNIFYAIGYSGHGVNLTSVFGRIIADLEAGRDQPWKQFPFLNNRLYYVANEPFRWLAAQGGIAFYRLTEGTKAADRAPLNAAFPKRS